MYTNSHDYATYEHIYLQINNIIKRECSYQTGFVTTIDMYYRHHYCNKKYNAPIIHVSLSENV